MIKKTRPVLVFAIIIIVVAALGFPKFINAQESGLLNRTNWSDSGEAHTFNFPYDEALLKNQMVSAILRQLSFCKRRSDERPAIMKSCAENNCEQRIGLFVEYIVNAAKRYNLNPWMLSAVAYNESRFNPFATGIVEERGIFQMNPKTKRGKKTRFVLDPLYRKHCRTIPGNCQEEMVEHAANHLRSAIEKCGGSWIKGLSMYNGGTCEIRQKYVYKTRKAWKSLEKETRDIPWCDKPKRTL